MAETNLIHPDPSDNQRSLERLARAIVQSQGEFSLILVFATAPQMRDPLMQKLRELCRVDIQEIVLHPSVKTLYSTLQTTLEEQQPEALAVFGLESVSSLGQLIASMNVMRDEFRKCFQFPLILWVSDEILKKLTRQAPDFKSWATTIRFEQSHCPVLTLSAITA